MFLFFFLGIDRENLATEKVQKYLQTQGVSKKNFFKFVQYTTVDFAGPDGRPNAVKIEEFNFDATVAKAAADEGVTTLTADQEAGMKQTVTDFEASPAYVEHNEVIVSILYFPCPSVYAHNSVNTGCHA